VGQAGKDDETVVSPAEVLSLAPLVQVRGFGMTSHQGSESDYFMGLPKPSPLRPATARASTPLLATST
jgi:hypothetical protein